MLTTYIYSLSDPRTDEIRYVGKTINLKLRLKEHRRRNLLRHNNTYKGNWLLSLYALGLEPVVNVLEIVVGDAWGQRERWWINHLKFQCRLTNYTLGGEGVPGRVRSADEKRRWREKMVGRTLPEEHKKRIGTGLKKHYATTGRPAMTQEQKDKISKTLTGRKTGKRSIEFSEKLSQTRRLLFAQHPEMGKAISERQLGKPCANKDGLRRMWLNLSDEKKAVRIKRLNEGRARYQLGKSS